MPVSAVVSAVPPAVVANKRNRRIEAPSSPIRPRRVGVSRAKWIRRNYLALPQLRYISAGIVLLIDRQEGNRTALRIDCDRLLEAEGKQGFRRHDGRPPGCQQHSGDPGHGADSCADARTSSAVYCATDTSTHACSRGDGSRITSFDHVLWMSLQTSALVAMKPEAGDRPPAGDR